MGPCMRQWEREIYQMMPTYNDKDGLKDGTSLVPPPVGLTKEGTK